MEITAGAIDTGLSLAEKVGQLFFVGLPGPELDDAAREVLETIRPGGICFFARNIRDARQTRELLDKLTASLSIRPFLSIDQEGGLVDRLRRILQPMPAADRFHSADEAREFGRLVGEALLILGFNMNFAPVVDVVDEFRSGSQNGLRSRTFGRSADQAYELGAAFLAGLEDNGCIGCLKHFPGLGASRVDSHEDLPAVDISEEELETVDIAPYRRILQNSEAVPIMIAHAAYPAHRLQEMDQNGRLLPSSLSFNFVTDLLRTRLQFNGLVLTDDLEMGAVMKHYSAGEACVRAIRAGNDMVTICATPERMREGFERVMSAVQNGEIERERLDESLERISHLKPKLSQPPVFDRDRLTEISNAISELAARLAK
jgi:beta-N-acetylhexosaminidase